MFNAEGGNKTKERLTFLSIETAPRDGTHIIIIDVHGFVYRAWRQKSLTDAWYIYDNARLPIFDDNDLLGWVPLPDLPL